MLTSLQFTHERTEAIGDAIAFDFRLKNDPDAFMRILGIHAEFWQTADLNGNRERRVGELRLDARSMADSWTALRPGLKPGEDTPVRLIWAVTKDDLQQIEDQRAGMSPVFRILPMLLIDAVWPVANVPQEKWRKVFDWERPRCGNGWPLLLTVPDREWIRILDGLKFKHNTLDRLSWPALPPAFKRSEENLASAWQYHRTGDFDAALNACYKAFDCLGFNLTGDTIRRAEVLDLLLEGIEQEKRDLIGNVMKMLTSFFHLGRHESGAPVRVTYEDSKFAVAAATIALSLLGEHYMAKNS